METYDQAFFILSSAGGEVPNSRPESFEFGRENPKYRKVRSYFDTFTN
jgi:hypothetical protein